MGVLRQEQLVEDRALRDSFVSRVDVLDKVGKLKTLQGDLSSTLKLVADYFNVDESVVKMTVHRHKDELEQDGMKNLIGVELSNIKLLCGMRSNKARAIMIFPRRAVLRVGMLLRDSLVAKQIRTYLLNVEEQSTPQQKVAAVESTSWANKDLILYDIIIQTVLHENGTLIRACEIVSEKIGKTAMQCKYRYSSHIKKNITDELLKRKIEGNRHGYLDKKDRMSKLSASQHIDHPAIFTPINEDDIPDFDGCRKTTTQELMANFVLAGYESIIKFMDGLNNDKIRLLEERVASTESQLANSKLTNKRLLLEKKATQEDLDSTRAVIASSIKIRIDEELNSTFKMDCNGNLKRI